MEPLSSKTQQLLEKLETLSNRQENLQKELNDLREMILGQAADEPVAAPEPLAAPESAPETVSAPVQEEPVQQPVVIIEEPVIAEKSASNLEKFIGANLINKIGIAVTILGVAVGTKYAIDHNLISPLTRILLGYLVGAGLLGFALKLKKNYHNFSAVLFSGAMAIFYLLTYIANSFYDLIPALPTFSMMVAITIVTVGAAIFYNRQVISHIGLVGAYAVPFLVETGPARAGVLFTYMAIINAGILVLSIKRYWKPLLYSSFIITWLVFMRWIINLYDPAADFLTGFVFAAIFFLIFYMILIGYKLLKEEDFELEDILLILANSGIFYGFGYSMLDRSFHGSDFLGLFTVATAAVHLGFWQIIRKRKEADRTLQFFIGGLAIVFLTIAIPVQLDGRWVTILWAAEAALLFYLGRSRNTSVYEWLAIPMVVVMSLSLTHDWLLTYGMFSPGEHGNGMLLILNLNFLTSFVVIAALGFMTWIVRNTKFRTSLPEKFYAGVVMDVAIPSLLILFAYLAFLLEIQNFFGRMYDASMINLGGNPASPRYVWNQDVLQFERLTIFIYSMLFFSLITLINNRRYRNIALGYAAAFINILFIALLITYGLLAIGELRDSFLAHDPNTHFQPGILNILIRYVGFLVAGMALYTIRDFIRQDFHPMDFRKEYDVLLHLVLLTMISNELINWMNFAGANNSFKLGLSILFGSYSLLLILLGIFRKKKHLRISAMVLFGGTLIKLFFYDLTSLDTISKTIIFISLGILLLIISFLYNKYATHIFSDTEENQ